MECCFAVAHFSLKMESLNVVFGISGCQLDHNEGVTSCLYDMIVLPHTTCSSMTQYFVFNAYACNSSIMFILINLILYYGRDTPLEH